MSYANPLIALPSILAVQRSFVISDATFSNVLGDESESPLWVTRGGIRGTVNTLKRRDSAKDEVRNIQETDTAKLHPAATAFRVRCSLAPLPLAACIASIADIDTAKVDGMRAAMLAFFERCQTAQEGTAVTALQLLSARYVRNLLNGRWLWRNRAEARRVEVTVRYGSLAVTADALQVPLSGADSGRGAHEGDEVAANERALANALADGFADHADVTLIVEATVTPAAEGAVEVYPSQNYLPSKAVGFARSLYALPHVDIEPGVPSQPRALGQAALRDQKVGNAIRTVDTWYPEFTNTLAPIAVEPNGANLDAQRFFRATPGSSAFDLLLRLNQLSGAADCTESLFMLACIVRGGVFNEPKPEKEKASAQANSAEAGVE